MAAPIFLLPLIHSLTKCPRCHQQYPKKQADCPHCAQLSDREAEVLRERKAEELEANSKVGKIFLLIGGVLAVLLGLMIFG